MERVDDLTERVREGRYSVPARAVAEAMLRHMIERGGSLAEAWEESPTGGNR